MSAGGQGAPLAPAFHEWLFQSRDADRVVLNIGGIANITVLCASDRPTIGFDTGPGNTLLDAWIRKQGLAAYDADGDWGASGSIIDDLLGRLLADIEHRLVFALPGDAGHHDPALRLAPPLADQLDRPLGEDIHDGQVHADLPGDRREGNAGDARILLELQPLNSAITEARDCLASPNSIRVLSL